MQVQMDNRRMLMEVSKLTLREQNSNINTIVHHPTYIQNGKTLSNTKTSSNNIQRLPKPMKRLERTVGTAAVATMRILQARLLGKRKKIRNRIREERPLPRLQVEQQNRSNNNNNSNSQLYQAMHKTIGRKRKGWNQFWQLWRTCASYLGVLCWWYLCFCWRFCGWCSLECLNMDWYFCYMSFTSMSPTFYTLWAKLISCIYLGDSIDTHEHFFLRFLQVWSRLNERFQISQKVYHFGSSGVELFTLVTGINVKDWFARRRKKNATDDDLDNTPIVFPENSAQAIIQLLSEKDSRPYRCVSSL